MGMGAHNNDGDISQSSSSAMAQQKKIVFKACGALPGDNARILLEAFKDAFGAFDRV